MESSCPPMGLSRGLAAGRPDAGVTTPTDPPMSSLPSALTVTPAIHSAASLDGWLVPPDTATRRKRGRGPGPRRAEAMHPQQLLIDLVEQFCTYQQKQRGKTEGGATTYRWTLERFLVFVRKREGRPARIGDRTPERVRAWMDHMAAADLAISTIRSRQSTLSSLCTWLVKRETLRENPVAKLDRPRYERAPPTQVPGAELMDALIAAAKHRKRPRDIAIFLILRYTGMRRESVASLDRKSTRLNSSHDQISYAVFCLKKKKNEAEHKTIYTDI